MRYRHLRFPEFRAKAFTTSWDDGSIDDIRLVEMLNKYGIKGTFNISSNRFADEANKDQFPRNITLAEAKDLFYPNGHEVAVHGLRHISPYQSSPSVRIHEVLEDRIGLEHLFGRIIYGMACPDDGRCTPEMRRQFADVGFHYCRCLSYDTGYQLPEDFMYLQPTVKHIDPTMPEKLDRFLSVNVDEKYISQRQSLWFYMWGHSHELRGQDKWGCIDEAGRRVLGHDEIWFATNAEIVEYVRAYRSLICAADDSIIYNPTQTTIWMEVDKQNVTLAPGETKFF